MSPTKRLRVAIYARVSTDDQNCELQLTELRAYAERMNWDAVEYTEKMSSVKPRAVLDRLLVDARMKQIDVVIVWKLDRFGRSVQQLTRDIQSLDTYGVRFIALTQGIDTDAKNPASRLMLHMFAAFAEFERAIIVERVAAGLAQYGRDFKAGKIGKDRHSRSGRDLPVGRPVKIFRRDLAAELRSQGLSIRQIAKELGVSKSTVSDALKGVR